MTIIELNDEEAALFLKFREYQDIFQLLVSSKVFENLKNKQITINCDNRGIAEIKQTSVTFKASYPQTTHTFDRIF